MDIAVTASKVKKYGVTSVMCTERKSSTRGHLLNTVCIKLCSSYPSSISLYYLSLTKSHSKIDIGTETFLHTIPASLASEHAAPLQCAGATVYSALISVLYPGARVGIIGIGGLGHLAIQFSAKLGHDTVVFSTTKEKEDEARGFGATEFYLLREAEKLKKPVSDE